MMETDRNSTSRDLFVNSWSGMTPADRGRVSVKKEKLSLQELITQASACDGQNEKPN